MAQIVKLRRSSVSGQKPTNSNLQLGELALNTTDGKVFMAVSGSGGPSVQELVSTNTVNTGSIYITDNVTSSFFTGSFIGDGSDLYNIPMSGVTDLITVSGSIDGRLDALETLNHNYTGSFSGSFDGRGQVDYLTFNTSSAPLTAPSYSLWANTTDKTLNLQMGNNATLQIGQELYFPPVVNKSGADLNDGDLVMINPAGVAQGNRISIVKAVGNGTYPADYIVGVLTENIANNQEGFATWFGYVRDISKTHLVPSGETWSEGQILYPHPTIAGKMTNILPTAPNLKSTIAAITSINGNNVTLLVRPNLRGAISGQHDVNILSGVTTGDLFVRNGSVWTNTKGLNGNYSVTGSLNVTNAITASVISGTFVGDGNGLYNLPNVSGGTNHLAYFNTDHSVTSSYFAYITNTGNTLGLGTDGYNLAQPERLIVDNGKSFNIATFQTSRQENFAEVNIKNFGSGSASSADLVLWNDISTETSNYVNLGINSSNYTASEVGYNNDGYLYSSDNDLYIGSLSTGSHGHLHLFAGNLWDSSSLSIYNDGTIGINLDKDDNNATTIPSSVDGFAVEISGSVKFRNDIVVQGTITAEEIHTSYVTSSVLYQSGSNKFGNTDDDIHQFTGSVQITGSLFLNGQSIGADKLNSTEFYTYTSSINPRLQSLETESGSIRNEFNVHTSSVNFDLYSLHVESGSIRNAFNTFTSSYRTGSFTGSFVGDGSGLENVPLFISGADINGNQYSKNFYKLHFDSDTGLNVSESIQGTAFISIGSHFKDIFVDGQPILSATGSDAFEIIPEGGVEIFTSITDTNYNSYTKELKFSTLALSSSLDSRINTITGSLNDFTSSINTFTSSVVLTSQTSSMTVLSSSFAFNAVTAAFALNASAGTSTNDGAYKIHTQTTPSTTWTFNHQLGQRYPIFQVFDTDGKVIIPTEITTVNSDNATISFSVPTAGKVIASLGVGPGGLSQYFSAATTWSLSHNLNVDYPLVNIWDTNRNIIIPDRIESIDTNNIKVYLSTPKAGYVNVAKGGHIISGSVNAGNVDFTNTNIISGSNQIRNHGFAITGSNIFLAPQTINSNLVVTGTTTIGEATIKQCTVTGITSSSAICSLLTGSYNGAFFDYIVKNGVNMRAGTIMSAWEGGSVVYNETSTNDLGNTNPVTMSVNISGGSARLFAQVSSGTWSVSTLTRAIGGMGTTGGGTNYSISTGYTAPDYCSGLFGTDQSVYGNAADWLEITRFYTDSSLTTPFNGDNKYYGNSNADYGTTLQIDTSGYVVGFYAC